MLNTDTHILYEPYENEDYFNRDNFSLDEFIERAHDIISSIHNINYKDIDIYKELDYTTINDIITIDLPKIPYTRLLVYYQYSNYNEIQNLINYLDSKLESLYSLTPLSTIHDIENVIDELHTLIEDIDNGNCVELVKHFHQYKDINKNFEDIISIANSSFYSELINWISQYPHKILEMRLHQIGSSQVKKEEIMYVGNRAYNIEKNDNNIKEQIMEYKKDILILLFKLYSSLTRNIIETKMFWNNFLENINPNNEIDEFEFSYNTEPEHILNSFDFDQFDKTLSDEIDDDESDLTDDDIHIILSDLDEDRDKTDTDSIFGSEKFHMGKGGSPADIIPQSESTVKNVFKKISNFFKVFPGKINRIRKQFKLFRMRAKNHGFFMKYIGRIEGLYERYADEAVVVENGMKGDPVQILKEEAHDYINEVSNGFIELQHNLIDLSKKFASTGDPKQMFNMLKSFGGMYMGDVQKANTIPTFFLKSIMFKLGELILKNNKIYGYTPQSIAENGKIPPSNHAIVSLFVDRADEKPFEQKVSDIFKSIDSFQLIAKNEKEPIFELTVTCSDLLTKGLQAESFKQLKLNRKSNNEKFRMGIRDLVAKEQKKKKAAKELKNQYKACWKALENAFEYVTSKKNYIADLVQSYFVMMTRIDNLCKICITSMLHVETDHRDATGYNTGFKADKLTSHKRYSQYDSESEGRKTVGEVQREKMDKKLERQSKYGEARNIMRERAKAIKKAMRSGF